MSNYNKALDLDKQTLSLLVETDFYPRKEHAIAAGQNIEETASILSVIENNPELANQILQTLFLHTASAQGAKVSKCVANSLSRENTQKSIMQRSKAFMHQDVAKISVKKKNRLSLLQV